MKLSLREVIREVATTYRAHFWELTALAAIVFAPIALLEAVTEPIREVETAGGVAVSEALGAGLLVSALALLGEVFYAGVVAALVTARRGGEWRTLRAIARELPYLRLIAVDLLFIVAVLTGLLLLIVPGLIAIAWFVMAGPVVEIEGRGVRDAFRRSRELAMGNALRILALLIPLLLIGDALAEAAAASELWILGDGVAGHWLSVALGEILTVPVFGLAAVITTHQLIALKGPAPSELRPSEPRPSEPRPSS